MNKLPTAILLLLACAAPLVAQEATNDSPAQDSTAQAPAGPARGAEKVPDQAELDKGFEKTMSGATLVGHFSMDGRGGQPKEERYTIQKVTKQQGDVWLFLARIQFGGRDVTIPMRIPVKWAGDTAVISVTDIGFPGLGTYTARVLIYGDQYAGTWSGKDHGGHLWGRIERTEKNAGGKNPDGAKDAADAKDADDAGKSDAGKDAEGAAAREPAEETPRENE